MEGAVPSLQNLLVGIPSEASSLAVACVGHMVQDQISDPQQMAKNMKQLGSVVSRTFGRGDFAAGDARNNLFTQ